MNNILNNNTNIIMIIMALILIGLMIYIIKITRKENKEGFANASSTFGGMTFDWDETSKTLNITGGKVNIPGITKLSNTDISGATKINGAIIDMSGNITVNSIKIGNGEISWDNVNNRLYINKDISTNNIQASSVSTFTTNGKTTMGAKDGFPGIFTDQNQMKVHNFTFGVQNAGGDNSGMVSDKVYDYIRSDKPSYALINPSNSGHLGTAWSDNRLYINYLDKNNRVGPNTASVTR